MATSNHLLAAAYSPELLVTYRGVPLGRTRAHLTGDELIVGELRAEPGYDGIRDVIRDASASLWAAGFFGERASVDTVAITHDAVARAAELPLELRDVTGRPVWTDFVNIVERPDPAELPVVFARLRLSPAPKDSPYPPEHRTGETTDTTLGSPT